MHNDEVSCKLRKQHCGDTFDCCHFISKEDLKENRGCIPNTRGVESAPTDNHSSWSLSKYGTIQLSSPLSSCPNNYRTSVSFCWCTDEMPIYVRLSIYKTNTWIFLIHIPSNSHRSLEWSLKYCFKWIILC